MRSCASACKAAAASRGLSSQHRACSGCASTVLPRPCRPPLAPRTQPPSLLDTLQLDTWVAQHEEEEAAAERAQQAAAEDGWTVVVRSKVGGALPCQALCHAQEAPAVNGCANGTRAAAPPTTQPVAPRALLHHVPCAGTEAHEGGGVRPGPERRDGGRRRAGVCQGQQGERERQAAQSHVGAGDRLSPCVPRPPRPTLAALPAATPPSGRALGGLLPLPAAREAAER